MLESRVYVQGDLAAMLASPRHHGRGDGWAFSRRSAISPGLCGGARGYGRGGAY